MNWKEILALVASIGTLASPIDILPEAILGPLGLGDDAIAVVVAGFTLYKAIKRMREVRAEKTAGGDTPGGAAPGAPKPSSPGPGAAGQGTAGQGAKIIVDPPEPGARR